MQWADVLADKSLEDLPYKIELNEWGNVEMSPATNKHSIVQSELADLLNKKLPYGRAIVEFSIQIENQVRVPDVVWCSKNFLKQHIKEDPCSVAPEICIEVVSPSNSFAEMKRKMALYFKAGAKEVWLVDFSGKAKIFNEIKELEKSAFDIDVVLDLDW
jgi:Uma2 family endonuclease